MSCTEQQLQDFIDEIPENVLFWMDQDRVTLRAPYIDTNDTTHQLCFEIGSIHD